MSINQQMLPPQLQARGPMGPGVPQQAPLPQSGQRTTSRSDMSSAGSSSSVNNGATVSRNNSSEDNKENARGEEPPSEASQPPRPSSSLSSTSSHQRHQRQSRDEKISVKERTKTFNRMCSEVRNFLTDWIFLLPLLCSYLVICRACCNPDCFPIKKGFPFILPFFIGRAITFFVTKSSKSICKCLWCPGSR